MKPRTKYLLLGVTVCLVYAITFAPASLVKQALETNTKISVSELAGSLWAGQASLHVAGQQAGEYSTFNLGQISWHFAPLSVFSLQLVYDIQLQADTHTFKGRLSQSMHHSQVSGEAVTQTDLLNQLLLPYDIHVAGNLTIKAFDLQIKTASLSESNLPEITQLQGQIHWPGGPIEYRLSGQTATIDLPALQALLSLEDEMPNLRIYQQSEISATSDPRIPLILGSLDKNGWVSLGITKKFTHMIERPWSGSEPDHAVVLEVQEKLL